MITKISSTNICSSERNIFSTELRYFRDVLPSRVARHRVSLAFFFHCKGAFFDNFSGVDIQVLSEGMPQRSTP
jgi:hypothetical protein